MSVTFNHTIIPAKDRDESARFFRELFELHEAPSWGPFTNVQLDEGVLLQFAELPGVDQIQMHHYAFLVCSARAASAAPETDRGHWTFETKLGDDQQHVRKILCAGPPRLVESIGGARTGVVSGSTHRPGRSL